MKRTTLVPKVLISIIFILNFHNSFSQFIYLNPLPGSQNHNPQTALAIRNGNLIDRGSILNNSWMEIIGSKSGFHSFTSKLADDNKTIIVNPTVKFDNGEIVSVIITNQLKKQSGEKITGTTFTFQIKSALTTEQQVKFENAIHLFNNDESEESNTNVETRDLNLDSLPPFVVTTNNNAAPGQIFYSNTFSGPDVYTNSFATIIENNDSVTWARDLGESGFHFNINYNGNLTYWDLSFQGWIQLDSNYNLIDSILPGNGYESQANHHDCSIYPDGHVLILIVDPQTVDLTQYGGKADATVTGVIIQELDAERNVIFEWRSWDHFQITDADEHISLTSSDVDYVHPNAISRDDDGNIILCCRALCEVTKINSETGEIMWRLGGENNQFSFINDNIPEHFKFQHDAHRAYNGNLTLFNNGKFITPQRSSAKEYKLDEVNLTATLVWYYEHPDVSGNPVYGPAMGSSQKLPNGNTIISWGSISSNTDRPTLTEVDSNKNITWEMKFDEYGQSCYQVHKYLWRPCEVVKPTSVEVVKITTNSAKVQWSSVNNAVSYDLLYRKVGKSDWKIKNTTGTSKKLINLSPAKSYEFQLQTHCINGYTSDLTVLDTFTTLPARISEVKSGISSLLLFPNPTSDLTTIKFKLLLASHVIVKVYDVSGREIITLLSDDLQAGEISLPLQTIDFSKGVYLVKLISDSGIENHKLIVQ